MTKRISSTLVQIWGPIKKRYDPPRSYSQKTLSPFGALKPIVAIFKHLLELFGDVRKRCQPFGALKRSLVSFSQIKRIYLLENDTSLSGYHPHPPKHRG
jgi:hypothetical protein